ncbi:HNH endonuclease signature motif containing protein [uncultured Sulfitobacter sp.]|uniref:HNH endonuclease signature motif containing protein n=1 Tax=uncultured Sulfitobacter sp. TaxID=191468 RepID=UPI0030DACCCB|tara:strand:+ start:4714 stop:5214 length:501 start_codon:yes stop_codon:yes gene_type:complete
MRIHPETLKGLIDYNPNTGLLRWKRRGVEFFKAGERQVNSWSSWNSRNAGMPCFCTLSNGYLCGKVFGTTLKAHRVAWAIHTGAWPEDEIDHINRNKKDNRIENLRQSDRSLNNLNKKISKTNKTGFKGVHAHNDGGFVAKYRSKYLGIFLTVEDAVAAVSSEKLR